MKRIDRGTISRNRAIRISLTPTGRASFLELPARGRKGQPFREAPMSSIPRLYTPRLILRPFVAADGARVRELAGDKRIADMTLLVPHPYPLDAAETWIARHEPAAARGEEFVFAITLAGTRTPGREQDLDDTGHLIGAVGIGFKGDPDNACGDLGYWLGVHYWNRGFMTEAARAVLAFGFTRRHYHKIACSHFAENTASGRVIHKLGLLREGVFRHALRKDGAWIDLVTYGILAEEWTAQQRKPARSAHTPATRAHVVSA